MLSIPRFRRAFSAFSIAAVPLVGGCDSDGSSGPSPSVPTRIVVAAPTADLYEGDVYPLSATVLDGNGQVISGALVTWSVSDATRGELRNNTVQLLAAGSVTVTATTGSVTGSRTLTVRRSPVVAITLGLQTGVIVKRGDITPVGVRVQGVGGRDLIGRQVQIVSDDPAIAVIDAAGRLRGVSAGSTTVRATAEGVTATLAVQIAPEDATLTLAKLGEQSLPVRVDAFSVESGEGPLQYETWIEGGDLTLSGGPLPRYNVTVRFTTYRVITVNGQRALRLEGTSRDLDFGTVRYDARGDLVMTSERIAPLGHTASAISGGFRMQYRSPGDDQVFDLLYRREPR